MLRCPQSKSFQDWNTKDTDIYDRADLVSISQIINVAYTTAHQDGQTDNEINCNQHNRTMFKVGQNILIYVF